MLKKRSKAGSSITASQLRRMLDLLMHASQCRSAHCQYPNCRKAKDLFRHRVHCKTRASGGRVLCKKMWYLLKLHARACKESQCHVPRCRYSIDIKLVIEDDARYWEVMSSALSVGWLDIVAKMLHLHGSYQLDQLSNRKVGMKYMKISSTHHM
ncbi:hypothetical protein RIF29_15099 [Crotalaria pallida]|uniref:Nuclear pore complex protein Nup85 n=1 Tax=Crotalaria pallida TaxID=3830 RepID=A0AAN9IDB4_CROPI